MDFCPLTNETLFTHFIPTINNSCISSFPIIFFNIRWLSIVLEYADVAPRTPPSLFISMSHTTHAHTLYTRTYFRTTSIYRCHIHVIYQQFIAMYDSGCQIFCNWSRLKPRFKIPAHRSTIPQINMIPHPATLNLHWTNKPCSRP